MRYAKKSVIIDGKQYNAGDIVPDTIRGDIASVEKHSTEVVEPYYEDLHKSESVIQPRTQRRKTSGRTARTRKKRKSSTN